MSPFDALYLRFPKHEFAIRRRLRTDDNFRAVCVDYCDAYNALRHWEAKGSEGSARVAEYRQLLDELTEEVATNLRIPVDDTHGPHTRASAEILAHPSQRGQKEPRL